MFTKVNFKNILNFILFIIIFGIFFIYPLLSLSKILKNFFQPIYEETYIYDDILEKFDEEVNKFFH